MRSRSPAVRRLGFAALPIILALTTVVIDPGGAFAQATATTSREYPVARPVAGAARLDQAGSAAVSNGDGYLVAWTESRLGRTGSVGTVRAARLSRSGVPLDIYGISVSKSHGSSPSVAWNNGVYLVVWQQNIAECVPSCPGGHQPNLVPDVYGARIDANGTVLDPDGFPIATGTGSAQDAPAVAPLGTGFVVAFHDTRADRPGIRAVRVSPGGAVLDPDGIDVSVGATDDEHPAVASNAGVALIAWVDRRTGNPDIRAKRLGAHGVVIDRSSFALTATAAAERRPAVAANGTSFLVAWDSGTEPGHVYASRVSGGTVLDPGGFRVSEVGSVLPYPKVASDGSDYLVSWLDWRQDRSPNEVRARRVGASDGFAAAPSFVAGTPAGYTPIGMAWGPGGYLVSWDKNVNGSDVFANVVPASGPPAVTSGRLLSAEPNQQVEPAAAWDGSNYLVAWSDERAGADIYAGRVRPDGTALDGSGVLVSDAFLSQVHPEVVWTGSQYFVVWRDYRTQNARMYAARVTRDGQVLDPGGFLVSLGNYDVAPSEFGIASDGSELMVVWRGYDYSSRTASMYASRVSGGGTVVGHIRMADAGSSPRVAWNGRRYLITWRSISDSRNIHALRVTGGRPDQHSTVLSLGAAAKSPPEVTSDGTHFFLAWADGRSGGMDIYGARVSDAATVLDPGGVPIFGSPEYDTVSGLAWNGHNYVVASRLTLIRVTRDAQVVDPGGITPQTTAPWLVGITDLAAGPPGDVAVLLNRTIPEPPYNNGARAFVRFFRDAGA